MENLNRLNVKIKALNSLYENKLNERMKENKILSDHLLIINMCYKKYLINNRYDYLQLIETFISDLIRMMKRFINFRT